MNLSDLEKSIIYYATKYYNGHPEITDSEFDALIEQLKIEKPDSYILKTPGWGYVPDAGELNEKHIGSTVGSLDKIKYSELHDNIVIFPEYNNLYIITPKLDGNSVVIHYKNGYLQKCISRGNGSIGINITKNLLHAIPFKINNHNNNLIIIRGEAIITYEDFQNMDGSDPRSKCTGLLQSKNSNIDDIKKIKFIPYQIVLLSNPDSSDKFISKIDHFQYFSENGFLPIPFEILSYDDLYQKHLLNKEVDENLTIIDGHHAPVDGIVINKVNNNITESTYENEKILLLDCDGIAYKYPEETKRTEIIDIQWNISWNKRFVPVLQIKEVEIKGVKINRVTANNYKWLVDEQCGIGSIIEIKRANECIPNIHKVLEKSTNFNKPSVCPYCHNSLEIDKYGTNLICNNENCHLNDLGIVYKIWEYIKPDGASDACFKILIQKLNNIKIPENYSRFKNCDIITQLQIFLNSDESEVNNHYHRLIEESKTNFKNMSVSISDIIKMSNINTLGKRIGSRIEEDLNYSVSDFLNYATFNKFPSTIFKYNILNKYCSNILKVLYIWMDKIQTNNNKTTIKVAVTGSLSMPRNKWFKEMEKYGVQKSSISKNCDYLICNAQSSNSSSYRKAIKYGVKIITEEDFMNILNGGI